jgi:glycosyltransferase involved in cell wall biosynthesis
MKILILTQIVDRSDPILGFFHQWIKAFSDQADSVEVLCLKKGEFTLPANVRVHSLGKESHPSRLRYLLKFYSAIWKLRREYDAVFVHMNPEYVVLGWVVWMILGKKVSLWYAHGVKTTMLRIATWCAHIVFTSTTQGFPITTSKVRVVGQGIDIDLFKPDGMQRALGSLRLITVSRISRSKNILLLLHALKLMKETAQILPLTIVGEPITAGDHAYKEELENYIEKNELSSSVTFAGGIPNKELPHILSQHDVLINAYAHHSLDKALLEAMACGLIVVSSNTSYTHVVHEDSDLSVYAQLLVPKVGDVEMFASNIGALVQLCNDERMQISNASRAVILKKFNLPGLISRILSYLRTDI